MSSLGRKGAYLFKSPHGRASITSLPSKAHLVHLLSLLFVCHFSGPLNLDYDSFPLRQYTCVYISETPFLFVFIGVNTFIGDK